MANSRVDQQKLRQVSFYIFLVFLFVFLFLQMSAFLPAFLGAITFYMLSRKIMRNLVEERHWKKGLAAFLILLVSFLVVMLPIWLTVNILTDRVGEAIHNSNKIISAINTFVEKLEHRFHIAILKSINPGSISAFVANSLKSILTSTFNSLTSVLLMYFILYFMLVSRKELEEWSYNFIPLKEENVKVIGKEMKSLVISNALGIPLVAVLQGIVGLIAYIFLGVQDVWFWFIFTCISSMIPFIGAALAYVPLSLILFAAGDNLKGVILLIYGLAIIGTVDNVFRFVLQKKMGDVHPLITVFGVVIGLNLFGFIGLIFGPILISLFILLVKIYMNEFVDKRKPSQEQLETGKQVGS